MKFLTTSLIATFLAVSSVSGSETVAAAAEKAYRKGSELLAAGNAKGALTVLSAATRMQPNNGAYHLRMCHAHLAMGNLMPAWAEARKAARLQPKDKETTTQFEKLWSYFDREHGAVNVGTAEESVLRSLGEPDKLMEGVERSRLIYGYIAIDFRSKKLYRTVDLRGLTEEILNEVETLRVPMTFDKWKIDYHFVSNTNDNVEAVRKHEKIQDWTELLSKQRLPRLGEGPLTPTKMMTGMKKNLSNQHPDVEWTIVHQGTDSITYHWRIKASKGEPAQHEVARLIRGKRDFYRLAYTKKTAQLSDKELAKWIGVFKKSRLVPAG